MSLPSQYDIVEESAKNSLEIIEFAVPTKHPRNTVWDHTGTDDDVPNAVTEGIVGTILVLEKAIMVWIGWGEQVQQHCSSTDRKQKCTSSGRATNLVMGPLIVGLPRTVYQGAFSGEKDAATSKLIGSATITTMVNDDEETIGRSMASRLSQKLGQSVFVSCSFIGAPMIVLQGEEGGSLLHHTVAMAEREIVRLLQERDT